MWRPNCNVGGPQLAAAERFQRLAALPAKFPTRRIGKIVTSTQAEIRNLIVLLERIVLHLRRATREGWVRQRNACADDEQKKSDNEPLHRSLPDRDFGKSFEGGWVGGFDLSQRKQHPCCTKLSVVHGSSDVEMPFLSHGSHRI